MEDKTSIKTTLSEIKDTFTLPVICVLSKKYASVFYDELKKSISTKARMPTQCLIYDAIKNKNTSYFITNLLLGLYAKCKVTAYTLSEPLHSDLFIGLDVSRIDKISTLGSVNIVGKYGNVLLSRSIEARLKGEKIPQSTLEEVVIEAINEYKKLYKVAPPH